jgi:ABC-2 type transport system ATP-binding protein
VPIAIEVRDLKRSFTSVKKQAGLRGAFRSLIRPERVAHEALKGVSFEIEEGAFVGLVGANGAGKTTLLKILSGLIPPSQGRASVLGFTPFQRTVAFRRNISLVMGQKAQLWWDLPAIDAFDLLRAIYDIPKKSYLERVETLTTLLDVKPHLNTQIRRLSLGERMKMEIIGAILHWPKVLFLDEPTIGLDVLAAHKLREFLREHNRKEKVTIILTSHNMDDIERLCSRVMLIRSGEMLFDGAPQSLVEKDACRMRVRLKTGFGLGEVAELSGLAASQVSFDEDKTEGVFYLSIHKSEFINILQKVLKKTEILDVGIEEPSLEEVIQGIYAMETRGV